MTRLRLPISRLTFCPNWYKEHSYVPRRIPVDGKRYAEIMENDRNGDGGSMVEELPT